MSSVDGKVDGLNELVVEAAVCMTTKAALPESNMPIIPINL